MVKKVPLQNGEFVLVDDEDYERVMEHTWRTDFEFKNKKSPVKSVIKGKRVYLSRFLKEPKTEDSCISFKNGDSYDFRKDNLIEKTRASLVRKKSGHGKTSKYKGVSWSKSMSKWRADIYFNGSKKYLGSYFGEEEAAKAYNAAAIDVWGDDAYLNTVGEDNNFTLVKSDPKGRAKQTRKKGSDGFKGIVKKNNKFQSRITIGGEEYYLGTFNTKEQAAEAYDRKAYELYGDNAILNFPEKAPDYAKEVKNNERNRESDHQ